MLREYLNLYIDGKSVSVHGGGGGGGKIRLKNKS